MRATVLYGAGDIRVENVPDARLIEPTDALVTVSRACICGSDLWPYQLMQPGEPPRRMGHEAIGVVEAVGSGVRTLKAGAVGLCAVIAARRLGAERIIMMGHHPDRIALAKEFGATDVVKERGEEAVARVRALAGGLGVHSVLECVGTEEAMRTAIGIARAGGAVGRVGVPHYEAIPGSEPAFYNNLTIGGGPAPVRAYIQELLPDVLEGKIEPGRVFDRVIGLDDVPDGYRAMNEREAIKVMLKP